MANNIQNGILSNLFPETPHLNMIFVKGGSFMMRGKHKVTLSDFYIGKFPVTYALWKAVTGKCSSINIQNDNEPVADVSWDDIHKDFLLKLNEKLGNQNFVYRLPSETEWEYSACGGVFCKNNFDDTINVSMDKIAEYMKNNPYKPKSIEFEQPNELSIHGMFGDRWEWCEDSCQDDLDKVPVEEDLNLQYQYRVLRGLSCSARNYASPNSQNIQLGFRLACYVNSKSS